MITRFRYIHTYFSLFSSRTLLFIVIQQTDVTCTNCRDKDRKGEQFYTTLPQPSFALNVVHTMYLCTYVGGIEGRNPAVPFQYTLHVLQIASQNEDLEISQFAFVVTNCNSPIKFHLILLKPSGFTNIYSQITQFQMIFTF